MPIRTMQRLVAIAATIVLTGTLPSLAGDIDAAPIRYSSATADNAVSRLQERLDNGKTKLVFEKDHGYLRSLLRELNVPVSSQSLVFTKTSLQRQRISPRTPRALYFNDDMYVGFCRDGAVMELSAVDPNLGAVFYSLDQELADKPKLVRQGDSCLQCHASSANQGFPGHVIRSVYADRGGMPILSMGTHRVDHRTPLAQRWGGWYVTGGSGKQIHLGNLILNDEKLQPEQIVNSAGTNVAKLDGRFDMAAYLSPHSDLVALMVLEHQAEMHNLITQANFLTRMALHEEAEINKAFGRPAGYRSESTISRIRSAGEPLVKYLLFCEEARLTEKIDGTSTFTADFPKRGPRDSGGRSLRDFDLQTRLFKYPCSYLIYSAAFAALPPPVKEYVLRRVHEVLTGKDTSTEFAHLTVADRKAIFEILAATNVKLPQT